MKTIKNFDLKKKFKKSELDATVEKIASKLINNGASKEEALCRARSFILPENKYKRFARITQYLCEELDIETSSEYITMSTNRYGQHSWYIYEMGVENPQNGIMIRISDHDTSFRYDSDQALLINVSSDLFTILDKIEYNPISIRGEKRAILQAIKDKKFQWAFYSLMTRDDELEFTEKFSILFETYRNLEDKIICDRLIHNLTVHGMDIEDPQSAFKYIKKNYQKDEFNVIMGIMKGLLNKLK